MANSEDQTFCPINQLAWREWLEMNHQSESSVWLIYYKAASPKQNLTWSEAVDQALCFGWIDSKRKKLDEERFMQFFTKRKAKSIWSKINKDKVEKLEQAGLMKEAGRAVIEIAKENGSWNILDEVEQLIIPPDLEEAFKASPGSKDFYLGLSKSVRKGFLAWIVLAKRPGTRAKRIAEIVASAANNQKPKHFL